MAITNHERVGKALDVLNQGLLPFMEREMKAHFGKKWLDAAKDSLRMDHMPVDAKGAVKWDTQAILAVMWNHWNTVFKKTLGHAERSIVSELREIRNRWAQQNGFTTDDAYRALDSIHRLLTSITAMEANEIDQQKQAILRVRFDEQARSQTRKATAVAVQGTPSSGLIPWRDIATPHQDVASGRYQQAEFAADLTQVYRREGADEYINPEEFYRRTFPTIGLQDLLVDALRRLNGKGGNPVVKLQTNFGGGKTHSMIALYHLFSGTPATKLVGVEQIIERAEAESVPKANRAVIVGVALSPAQPSTKSDGTIVRTIWGEMAWQLLGAEGYALVAEADKHGVSPGSDVLRDLFKRAAPCLILIDEWIAYVRMLYGKDDMPGGSFDANLTFAQGLTEAARAVPGTLVVATIPISPRVSDQQREQIEIGGEAGKAALDRLEQVFARMESPWRPASAEESFEIVRRRLFEPITDHVKRDTVVRTFSDFYRNNAQEFPSGCAEGEYRRRMESAYPIHPELFERLYQDWASLERFQLTRGVLRLMAAVIHSLWQRNDTSAMIMPCMVPLDDNNVRKEMIRYLSGPWDAVVDRDVDGPNSLPIALDKQNTNLGRYSACRRAARAIFIGSAPTHDAANRGIEDNRVKLACAQPGESVPTFGDALRRLTDQATHLYVDKNRYWYSTQQNINRLAHDRASQYDIPTVWAEIEKRLKADRTRGDFVGLHSAPQSSGDIPDEMEARLVVIGPEFTHSKNVSDSPAKLKSQEFLEQRGTSPRLYKNMLMFLAPDKTRLDDLDQAVRQFLAWESIIREKESLNLDHFQSNLAVTKLKEVNEAVDSRIQEAYVWLLVPSQNPQEPIKWEESRLQSGENMAVRASRRLKTDEGLIVQFSATRLRMELDKYLWKDVEHINLKKLWEYFATYLYLPRLRNSTVLLEAVRDGVGNLTWAEHFAYAELYDEKNSRYVGLRVGQIGMIVLDSESVLVKLEVANRQLTSSATEAETTSAGAGTTVNGGASTIAGAGIQTDLPIPPGEVKKITRFFGSTTIDPLRISRDSARLAEEVVQHLSGLTKAEVKISLEIHAHMPDGVPDNIIRTVTENCHTLKFDKHGFEKE